MFSSAFTLLLIGGVFEAVSYCSGWINLTSETSCPSLLDDNFITLEGFRRWNPSITANCGNLVVGKSYCVDAVNEPATKSSNGIETPSPVQPSIVPNCDKFYFVKMGDTCDSIAKAQGISSAQFLAWNPSAGSSCTVLWADAYACVSIIGHEPSSIQPTTTTPGNGIATPIPIQAGMVNNCNSFYKVKSGDTCDTISSSNGISTSQLTTWNPAVGSGCTSLWLDYYICISIIGQAPTPTTTKPGNGITTPTPVQTGMTTSYIVR